MNSIYLILLGAVGFFFGHANTVCHLPFLALLTPLACALLGIKTVEKPVGSSEVSPRFRAFRYGWIVGTLGFASALYWVALPVHDFGGLPWILAATCPLLLASVLGLFFGIFSIAAYECSIRYFAPCVCSVLLGLTWYGLEWLRGCFLTGFPWIPLASAFVPMPIFIQGASVVGTYGLGGVFAGLSVYALFGMRRLAVACVLFACIGACGYIQLSQPVQKAGHSVHVALIQGNVPQNIKWDKKARYGTVERYINLTQSVWERVNLPDNAPRLSIWPETALPFLLEADRKIMSMVSAAGQDSHTSILVGTVRQGVERRKVRNCAILFGADGSMRGSYEKEHLVPFGEYIPPFLNMPFLQGILQGVGCFEIGENTAPLIQDSAYPELVSGVLICYESIFSELAYARVRDGATFFANISNDAWFGKTSAPTQHLYSTAMRSVEFARPLVRSTNTGISAFIDARGRICMKTPLCVVDAIAGEVAPSASMTIFFRIAPYLPWMALCCFVAIWRLSSRRNDKPV